MDWQALLNVVVIVALFLVMMRGCGRMGGGCGTRNGRSPRNAGDGGPSRDLPRNTDVPEHEESKRRSS